jgi:hypothetical protein
LLPGISVLERLIARIRNRVENRLYHKLAGCVNEDQHLWLEELLTVHEGNRKSLFDKLRTGPVKVSCPSLVHTLLRLQAVRELRVSLTAMHIPQSRIKGFEV